MGHDRSETLDPQQVFIEDHGTGVA